ncbi:hypothetical protein B6U98_03020 [Thermoplasmatales archaeon ex4572_165]|nr:MAG: hypothetical protein B6U98_03020 [Thermoplasmatales archaeon ex4572_165]
MDEGIIKNIEHKEDEFGEILRQLEIFERVYPYYTNMIQDHIPSSSSKESSLKSTMHTEK